MSGWPQDDSRFIPREFSLKVQDTGLARFSCPVHVRTGNISQTL